MTRYNPKIGKHPELFNQWTVRAHDVAGDETDVVVEDWREMSPETLEVASEAGELTEDDFAEMREYQQALRPGLGAPSRRSLRRRRARELDVADVIAEGVDREVARALASRKPDFVSDLEDLDERGSEARAKRLVDYLRERALWQVEYETEPGQDGFENAYVDTFQRDLESMDDDSLLTAASEVSDFVSENRDAIQRLLDEGWQAARMEGGDVEVHEVLHDPGNYDVEKHDEYTRVDGSVWAWGVGVIEDQHEGAEYDDELHTIVHGGEYTYPEHSEWREGDVVHPAEPARTVMFPGLSPRDITRALRDLENNEPYVDVVIGSSRGDKEGVTADDFDSSFWMRITGEESTRGARRRQRRTLRGGVPRPPGRGPGRPGAGVAKPGPDVDDVVYVYPGTNDFVSGASARGMYVARLAPTDLRHESKQLGHCIGNEQYGHPKALREGKTQVFSVRTEAGKSKFTIEMVQWSGAPRRVAREDAGPLSESGGQPHERCSRPEWFWKVDQVKGKANRLPGFLPGKTTLAKPDEVRLVTDFLMHLGFTPAAIREVSDVRPGVLAMEESGVDPFAPPAVRKKRPAKNPGAPDAAAVGATSPEVRAALRRTHPMGAFR